MLKITPLLVGVAGILALAANSFATTVQFQTSHGNFEVILFDEQTPKTVENFLEYTNELAYKDSIVHRSVKNFVIQGGGFKLTPDTTFSPVNTNAQVVNEAHYSNIRATISMAKRGGLPNSATSQWFFNVSNNSANLDYSNAGYTVFGQVVGDGMSVVDSIAALEIHNVDNETGNLGIGTEVPLQDYDSSIQVKPSSDNFVTIYNVIITDATTNNANELEEQPKIIEPRTTTPQATSKSGGALSHGWLSGLLILLTASFLFRKKD